MKRARPIVLDGEGMPHPPGRPPLAAATTFQDAEIRIGKFLCADAMKRNTVVARSPEFASFARKFQKLGERVEHNRALRATAPDTGPVNRYDYTPTAGELDGPDMARSTEPREPTPGDPEPHQRIGRPKSAAGHSD